jgi:outer membrane cobalamin receptor
LQSFKICLATIVFASNIFGQAQTGELRVTITDPAGLALPGAAEVVSEVNQYRRDFEADAAGRFTAKRLAFGLYTIRVSRAGFAPSSSLVDIHSAIPKDLTIALTVAPVQTSVNVTSGDTLIDPYRTNTVNRIGGDQIRDRVSSSPGRSLAELVNQQPGWMFEANGILHPRGEEYQTQYVMDGIPLTDNRSAAFIADFDVDEVQEMSTITAGFPAEYGRKMGGVVEVQTARDNREGFHGRAVASGGSFNTGSSYVEGQEGWGTNTLTVSAAAATTDRFLDSPVTQNYTNHGATADFMGHYEKDIDEHNRIGVIVRLEQSKFLVPNELIQQAAGQRQDRDGYETALQFSFTHIFSPDVVGDFRAMTRDITAGLWSNDLSTPMIVQQGRSYREGYLKAAVSIHHGNHEFKAGGEGDFANLREALSYVVTDPTQFDPGTPLTFNFLGRGRDREQSAFLQDIYRWKNFTLSAGVRFDHYSLLVDQSAWSPRVGLAYYWPWAGIIFRGSYDRIFQTPPFENILVSSSPVVVSLSEQVLRLPVQPARGEYFEAGFSKSLFKQLRFDTNFYHRSYSNYPDDDLLFDTGVSFPITFAKANIYGVEVKMEVPHWGPFSGYAAWSQQRGNGYFPVTGGLFLGDDAAQAISANSGVFPVSQEQRNALRARIRYQMMKRAWMAMGATYDTGLPIDFEGTAADAATQYGQNIVDRINFGNFRPRPLFSLNASFGVTLNESEKYPLRLQIDGANLTNLVNVIDFAGLFSGTAIGPPRSVSARLQMDF